MKRLRCSAGSSPLARGLPERVGQAGESLRIIPARAGFTMEYVSTGTGIMDHPRSRGVYPSIRLSRASRLGSSPLARGLPQFLASRNVVVGIIPARAGFTYCPGRRECLCRDHPRSRGVYLFSGSGRCCSWGSSPLARGLRHPVDEGLRDQGIIPARAGFTTLATPIMLLFAGSSPLARGLRGHPAGAGVGIRIIPARAGFTDIPARDG